MKQLITLTLLMGLAACYGGIETFGPYPCSQDGFCLLKLSDGSYSKGGCSPNSSICLTCFDPCVKEFKCIQGTVAPESIDGNDGVCYEFREDTCGGTDSWCPDETPVCVRVTYAIGYKDKPIKYACVAPLSSPDQPLEFRNLSEFSSYEIIERSE